MWLLPAGSRNDEVQDWLGRLFPASAGRTSSMNVIDRTVRGQDTYMFIREARILGFETLTLPGYRGRHRCCGMAAFWNGKQRPSHAEPALAGR
jgi:hypothetical protein